MTAHPQTILPNPPNAGQVGHPIYGRFERISLRMMDSLAEQARRAQKALGVATLNDYINYAVLSFSQAVLNEHTEAAPVLAGSSSETSPAAQEPPRCGVTGASEAREPVSAAPPAKDERDPLERFWEEKFKPWMKEAVGPENFETWFSSSRFLAVSQARCILEVHNRFFAEVLAETHKDILNEGLRALVGPEAYLEFAVRPERKEEPTPEPPKEEKPPTKYDHRIAILNQLRYSTPIYSHYDAVRKQLEAKWEEEDRLERQQQKEAYEEAWRDQQAKPSPWWSDDKATPKKLRTLAEKTDRELKDPKKPNSS